MTSPRFNWNKVARPNILIHCYTKEEARGLYIWAHRMHAAGVPRPSYTIGDFLRVMRTEGYVKVDVLHGVAWAPRGGPNSVSSLNYEEAKL